MKENTVNEKALVARAARKDKEAYRMLVERYQSRAFAIAFEVVRSREDAEDIVQESFVKAYLALKKFKGDSSFYTWLYRIVYNLAIDYKRKIQRRGGIASEYDESVMSGVKDGPHSQLESPDRSLERGEVAEQISAALSELTEQHRTIVLLREVDGLSYDEIAKIVGVKKGTVMSRLHYARKKLQESLKNYVVEDGDINGYPAVEDIEQISIN